MTPAHTQRSILVVDDEPCTRHLLKLLLESFGFLVHEANYGLDALKMAKASKPDLMIFDLKQNNGQGFAIFKSKEQDDTAVTPIALLNGQTHWAVFTKLLPSTSTQYIPKPVSRMELGAAFKEFLPSY